VLGYFKWISFALVAAALIISSDGGIEDRPWAIYIQNKCGYDISADFREMDVSTRPENYWLIDSTERDKAVKGASLAGADLRNADLYGAFLVNADLRGANLSGADLTRANLSGANLMEADITNALLNLTILSKTDLRFLTGLTQNQLLEAYGDSTTILPPGMTIAVPIE
jgi:uncharacterized protein YjbI with pentapeptide repeats